MEVPLAKESVEVGKGGSLKEGDEGRWYEEEDGRLLSPEECDVFDEALKDGRWPSRSEAMARRSRRGDWRGAKLKVERNYAGVLQKGGDTTMICRVSFM